MFTRVLVANRGEIARRVMRTCRDRGISTVAVYSDADRDAPHVHDADLALRIGPAEARASYLDVPAILAAAARSGADAIHPGYGFLAENAAFARAVAEAGLTFIGPSPEVIELMGDKAAAKRRLSAAGVPVVPGIDDDTLDDDALVAAADTVGFPLLVKAVAGGGGKGMRTVDRAEDLPGALAAARREAAGAFGDDRVILERLVRQPRHVEVQVFGDTHGHVVHLLERECSIQRRHQKLVEEAPSPALDETLRARMGAAAVRAAQEVGYTGAGTVEFLLEGSSLHLDEPNFFFLEMNTRLQVEHPVTELVTGFDLVGWQLDVAAGAPLPVSQDDVAPAGHAIEVRLYAEDPVGYLPQTGTITGLDVPAGPDVRFDTGIEVGSEVSRHYDPMLAKLIVHAPDRPRAVARLGEVLADTSVRGVVTNLSLLRAIVEVEAFRDGALDTGFLADHLADWRPPRAATDDLRAAARLVLEDAEAQLHAAGDGPWASLGPRRVTGGGGWPVLLRDGEEVHVLHVRREAGGVRASMDGAVAVLPDRPRGEVVPHDGGATIWLHGPSGTFAIEHLPAVRHRDVGAPAGRAALTAPMPGAVLAVHVEAGDSVEAGATLVVVEAMKMEHPVLAPGPGVIGAVHVAAGDTVDAGTVLVDLDAEEPGATTTDAP